MKNGLNYLFAMLFVFAIGGAVFAQATHTINFEPSGVGAAWSWTVSENADNPPRVYC